MALIKCVECGKEISDKSESCPHCGCPTIESITQQQIQDYKQTYKCKHCGNTTYKAIKNQFGLIAICSECGYAENITHTPQESIQFLTPECPYCHSHDTKKIGSGGRTLSLLTLGLAGSKIGKQWHCKHCRSDF